MMVMCKKRGLIAQGSCGACNEFEKPTVDDPWSNPQGVCAHFRYIVRNPIEEAAMGVKFVYPGTAKHDRASEEIKKIEDRDTDHIARKRFPIAISIGRKIEVPIAEKKLDVPKVRPKRMMEGVR